MEATGIGSDIGRDQFLQLLVTQLRSQDPLDPVKDQDFIAQLAQFSTLEGIEKLNASFGDLLALQQITQGANLIGRTVSYEGADGSLLEASVEGFELENSRLQLIADGAQIPLDRVRGMT